MVRTLARGVASQLKTSSCRARLHQIMTERPQCETDEEIRITQKGCVQHVVLNRPKSLNALNLSMVRTLTPNLKQWLVDPETSVVTVRGEGEKAFCSGGDLKSITFSTRDGGNYAEQFFYEEFSLNYIIGTYPKPLISLLNGMTFGGAAGLTVIGRFCVATERAVFCMPECAIGLFPDVGSGYYLSRLPGQMGLFLGLTGHRLRGLDILRAGLASHYVDYSKIPQLEAALESLSPPVTDDDVNNLLNDFQRRSVTNTPESFSLAEYTGKIAQCFGGDSVEEIVANLQQDGSQWAETQLNAISKMSPTSLKITFRLLREGMNKSLAESLQMEYRLTQRCAADRDFHEGIRAAILDKDGDPSWVPTTLVEVTDERIDHYFSPLVDPKQELVLTDILS